MDAPEDKDVKLQKASGDLLSGLQHTLPRFLWKSITPHPGAPKSQSHIARSVVGWRNTENLIKLLEPFQEWPQLLDPCLASIVPPLVAAYLNYLSNHQGDYRVPRQSGLAKTIPLPRAICKLLYTLCKIRGEKVISRFLNNEPKYLEPMLDAFKTWNENIKPVEGTSGLHYGPMVWEERYIVLLWLSHLMLAPFDLASISSLQLNQGRENLPTDMILPSQLPTIAERIIPICTSYMTVASKEREAARALLVRIALRPDMLQLGLLESSIHWALSSLEAESNEATSKTIYAHVGVLSFLAGILVSAEKAAIAPFLMPIFQSVQKLKDGETPLSKFITSSALARKVIIKILRAITVTVLELELDTTISSAFPSHLAGGIPEEVIDFLLASLADKDTPVRYAASKALSVIALKLDASMAADVVEAVVGSLSEDVLWEDATTALTIDNNHASQKGQAYLTRNLTAVSALRWQGLVLTLSHLLYRRSPPPEQLPAILNALVLALGFEQRSAVGSSVGTNVRDAACFGIWALARRYTTEELLQIDTPTILAANTRSQSSTVLQVLSSELVAAATLDSSGNIRRGASAALQELVGRHPDTVSEGISLVQVVDYHAIALRSRAMKEVAVAASKLSGSYWDILLAGFLGWRGIGSPDAESRRQAATSIGSLSTVKGPESVQKVIDRVCQSLRRLQHRQVEERHGLLLSLAAILDSINFSNSDLNLIQASPLPAMPAVWGVFEEICPLSAKDLTSSVLRPELMAEAACCVISSLASASCNRSSGPTLLPLPPRKSLDECLNVLDLCLARTEDVLVVASSKAAGDIFEILDDLERERLARSWIASLGIDESGRLRGANNVNSYIAALGTVYRFFQSPKSDVSVALTGTVLSLAAPPMPIESKVAALKSLSAGVLRLEVMAKLTAEALLALLADYTADQRGDVGSLVRVEAIDAVGVSWANEMFKDEETKRQLIALVCGLAAEKLDKVRFRAWTCIQGCWKVFGGTCAPPIIFSDVAQTSTVEYFQQLLSLYSTDWIRLPLLKGYITSAGVGSESLLRASRAALVEHAERLSIADLVALCQDLVEIVRQHNTDDRLIIPALEVIAFLFDAGQFQRINDAQFKWRNFFALIQKSHFKSGNVHKLEAAVKVYTGLATVDALRQDVLAKLSSMLIHPFPQIRNAVADALCVVAGNDLLTGEDWSKPPKELKEVANGIRVQILVGVQG